MADTNPNDETLPHPTGEQAQRASGESAPHAHKPADDASDEHTHDELSPGQTWSPVEETPSRDRGPIETDLTAEVDAPADLERPSIRDEADSDEGVSEFLMESATTAEGEAAGTEGAAGKPVKVVKRPRDTVMVVNDAIGDECRIAFARGRKLESYFAERAGAATNVGNIYKGRVTNVEAAIQAAFIDFGEGQNGFLHISDVHPKYFPGGDKAERVGHKIPRRERPPIQECLKKGQEVLVQVIKQGIGTKGPTVTSYLSIPGRLLVMMPDMDKVGVSRKVEDETQRREMRRILDSLELPNGCGFILRTAGFDRSRTELQRDAAYLTRLWEAMRKRIDSVGAPAELYTESDVLLRTVREMVDDTVSDIVVDSVSAWNRVTAFLDVVFPKDAPRVLFYGKPAPIFTAFDLERQIGDIYQRAVPLPSGGALVFDQTEALVAIDVNSGKSRSARDSETNAFETNKEAVDEICRQLRLRDMGGLVVCDLIDMRSPRHRREIEERFQQNLRKDRAKTTVARISEFGLVELTRQRMRPSVRKAHFAECPHCGGSGEVRMPDSTAGEALRRVMTLLGSDRVHRVEMVCSVRVASVLLSSRRDQIFDIERETGKRIDVRISEAIAGDRVDLYAYDDRGADVEIERLPTPSLPRLDELPEEPPEETVDQAYESGEASEPRRRRRRRKKAQPADATAMLLSGAFDDLPEVADDEPSVIEALRRTEAAERAAKDAERKARNAERHAAGENVPEGESDAGPEGSESGDDEGSDRRSRRRRRRRGRDRQRDSGEAPSAGGEGAPAREGDAGAANGTPADVGGEGAPAGEGGRQRRRRRRGGRGRKRDRGEGAPSGDVAPQTEGGSSEGAPGAEGSSEGGTEGHGTEGHGGEGHDSEGGERRGRRRRRRGGRGRDRREGGEGGGSGSSDSGASSASNSGGSSGGSSAASESSSGDASKPKFTFRSIFGLGRRQLTPGAARDAMKKDG
ncbi:MAG: Rne/Rng family ribonuclease [Planctomycetes bacterium]|nr:Rne/Rng family ribonuclease [Planctomycetota bacterium]